MTRTVGMALLALVAVTAAWGHDAAPAGAHDGTSHTHWWLDLGGAWYAGAGVGQARYDDYAVFDDGSFTSNRTDDSGAALRVFGGVDIGKYLALEATYADFGEATSRAQSDGSGSVWSAGPQAAKISAKGYDFSLVGRLPLTDDWGAFAKVGGSWLDVGFAVAVDAQCCGPAQDRSKHTDEGVSYGGGVRYDGWRPLRIVAEYGVLPAEVTFFAPEVELDWIAVSAAYLF